MKPKIRVITFGAVTVMLLILAAAPAITSANHSWNGYHWARASNPFNLNLGDNLSSNWYAYLATTSTDWSQSSVVDTSIVAGQAKGNCRPTAGRVEVCNKVYGRTGWLGVAQIWVSGKHITQGSVKLNDTYFSTPNYNTPAWRNLVMCQEIGHTLGLDHQDEIFDNPNLGTCMDYTRDPSSNQHPNQHDYDMLESIYAHLDSTTTARRMPAAAANGDFDTPPQWGKLIRSSANGKLAVYERDFGNEHKMFTFVIWAK